MGLGDSGVSEKKSDVTFTAKNLLSVKSRPIGILAPLEALKKHGSTTLTFPAFSLSLTFSLALTENYSSQLSPVTQKAADAKKEYYKKSGSRSSKFVLK